MAFPFTDYGALIADGAIRSGKTSFMMLSFVDDAMRRFNNQRFGICGKTVDSTVKNIITPYLGLVWAQERYQIQWRRTDKLLIVSKGGKTNVFEVFGGKDEASFMLIQGRTLAGVLFDEVALQPRSFVEQALARCSVDGSKFWFNCNPESPSHWFYREWIVGDQPKKKNALHLHFELEDNPSLSEDIIRRYKTQYTGVFYDRYILGLWSVAEGIIYPMYKDAIVEPPDEPPECYVLSIDYGTQNPFSAGLWAKYGDVWWRVKEYYYGGRETGVQKTDEEYGQDLDREFGDINPGGSITAIIDPSAASFIALLRKKNGRYSVRKANNAVLDGIRETATALQTGRIKIAPCCKAWIREAQSYVWDSGSSEDKPLKENDHAMDDTRYMVKTMRLVRTPKKERE